MKYEYRPTQEQRILDFLRERKEQGVWCWEITNLLRIMQYTSRIWGLRQKGYGIENDVKGHFVLTLDPEFDSDGQGRFV
jgi:hypothetical protein